MVDLNDVGKVLKEIVDKSERIAVVGPSASGKGVLSKILAKITGGTVISTDDFYVPDAWKIASVIQTFDHPSLMDFRLLKEVITREGVVEVPIYDMSISTRVGFKKVRIKKPVIVEGIFSVYGDLKELYDIIIAIDSPPHLLLARRMLRDVRRAKESVSRVLDRVIRTVFPMSKLFVEPQMKNSNVYVWNLWKPHLPNAIESCEKGGEEGKLERRIVVLEDDGDLILVGENWIEGIVEHWVSVIISNESITIRVPPETAYMTVNMLVANNYPFTSYVMKGYWKGEKFCGVLYNEENWERLGSYCCTSFGAPPEILNLLKQK